MISHTSWDTAKQTFTADLTAGGRIGFHAARSPATVLVNGQPVDALNPSNGLWVVETSPESVILEISL